MPDPQRAVLVTGAASGIGRATALRLARAGHRVALLDRDAEALGVVAKELADAGEDAGKAGVPVLALPADVTRRDEVDRALGTVAAEFGGLDGLACAAGILEPGDLAGTSEESWERHLAVNATGVFHCLKAAEPVLRDGGAVVVVSSNAARVPRAGLVAYSASKGATSALARAAGLELAARRIRCNVVEPGSTDTPMLRDLWAGGPNVDLDAAAAAVAGDAAAFRVGIPLARIADPDDVAAVVCFLLSPDARHVTLQQIFVDGGASL